MDWELFDSAGITRFQTREEWDAASPAIVDSLLSRWRLTAADRLSGGIAGVVLGVTQRDGTAAVLKVGYPHEEGAAEVLGLGAFPPGSAPRVLRQDATAWAMLLERLDPGTPLARSSGAASEDLRRAATLLGRLHGSAAPHDVPFLADVVGGQAARASSRLDHRMDRLELPGVHRAGELVAAALDDVRSLVGDPEGSPDRLVHGDFNPGNILRSGDEFAAIDPKPMLGDAAFDPWPLVSQLADPFMQPDTESRLETGLRIVADESGVDLLRAARWCVARSGLSVSWCLEDDDLELAAAEARRLQVWSRVVAGIRSTG